MNIPKKRRIDTPMEMAQIPITKVNPGNRVRDWKLETEEKKQELMSSIEERGQITPITVMKYAKPYEGYDYFLLAGGRRLGAMRDLGLSFIDAKIYPPDLSADEIYAIELRENIDRKDFTPEEEAKSIKRFHEACLRLYGHRDTGVRKTEGGHSINDTAEMLGLSKSKVVEALNAATLFEQVPKLKDHVRKWSDLRKLSREASRRVERKERIEKIEKEVKEKKEDDIGVKLKDVISSLYVVKDAVEGMKEYGAQTVDLVEFDPHYPIREDERSQQGLYQIKKELGDYTYVSKEDFESFFRAVSEQAYRILRPDGWFIIWFGYEFLPLVVRILREVGFIKDDKPDPDRLSHFLHGKWYKQGFGHTANPSDTLNHTTEPFLYIKRSSKARIQKPHEDVFIHSPLSHTKKANPFEKPIPLYEEIYQTFLEERSTIISACTGGGNAILAAVNLGHIAKGFDVSQEFKDSFVIKAHSTVPPDYGKENKK